MKQTMNFDVRCRRRLLRMAIVPCEHPATAEPAAGLMTHLPFIGARKCTFPANDLH